LPIQTYAFQASPPDDRLAERLRGNQDYYAGNVTLLAEEDGVAVADASAIPIRQNVRGCVYPMAGIAGVATLPLARRRGYGRALITRLLDQMRRAECLVPVPAVVLRAVWLRRVAEDTDGQVLA
jgi:GNAT superfamily N-acetyltransferase